MSKSNNWLLTWPGTDLFKCYQNKFNQIKFHANEVDFEKRLCKNGPIKRFQNEVDRGICFHNKRERHGLFFGNKLDAVWQIYRNTHAWLATNWDQRTKCVKIYVPISQHLRACKTPAISYMQDHSPTIFRIDSPVNSSHNGKHIFHSWRLNLNLI